MTRLRALDVTDVPIFSVPVSENFSTTPAEALEVGRSGHHDAIINSDQVDDARTPENLEVTEVGTRWASGGTAGQDSGASTETVPQRARMWKFSLPLHHPTTGRAFADLDRIRAGLQRKSIDRFMWLLHDRDAGSAPHVQGAIKMRNSRSREQLASMLGLPSTAIRPLVDGAGQHGAFERYCRYLLHESPEAQADGKFHYPDSVVQSNFDFRDMIDRYFGYASTSPALTSQEIKLKVYSGELSPLEVLELYPMIFIQHIKALEALWERGVYHRLQRPNLLEQYARFGTVLADESTEATATASEAPAAA